MVESSQTVERISSSATQTPDELNSALIRAYLSGDGAAVERVLAEMAAAGAAPPRRR